MTETSTIPRAAAFAELAKPGVTVSAMMTGAWGLAVSPRTTPAEAAAALAGVGLLVAAAGALNMAAEAGTDRRMPRTCERPVASGRVSVRAAAGAAMLWSTLGTALLAVFGTPLAGALAVGALLLYAGVYTPMKRSTPLALIVGAVPGAAPPLIVGAAVSGRLDAPVLALFAFLFLWQLPHFGGIVVRRRAEYRAAGLRIAPPESRLDEARRGVLAASFLLVAAPCAAAALGAVATSLAIGAGAAAIPIAWAASRPATDWDRWGRAVFLASLPYVPAVAAVALVSALL